MEGWVTNPDCNCSNVDGWGDVRGYGWGVCHEMRPEGEPVGEAQHGMLWGKHAASSAPIRVPRALLNHQSQHPPVYRQHRNPAWGIIPVTRERRHTPPWPDCAAEGTPWSPNGSVARWCARCARVRVCRWVGGGGQRGLRMAATWVARAAQGSVHSPSHSWHSVVLCPSPPETSRECVIWTTVRPIAAMG